MLLTYADVYSTICDYPACNRDQTPAKQVGPHGHAALFERLVSKCAESVPESLLPWYKSVEVYDESIGEVVRAVVVVVDELVTMNTVMLCLR